MSASVITGKIQDIIAGTSARAMMFESISDPSFDIGGIVTLNTQKQINCAADGTFSITLHAGSYRVVVSDTWQRSVWKITVPTDGLAHDISSIRVTGTPATVDTYYTAAAIDGLLAIRETRIFQSGSTVVLNSGGGYQSLMGDGIGSLILPAGFWATNKSVRFEAWGSLTTGAVGASLPFNANWGTGDFDSGVCNSWTVPINLTSANWKLELMMNARTIGAPGVMVNNFALNLHTAGASVAGAPVAIRNLFTYNSGNLTGGALNLTANIFGAGASMTVNSLLIKTVA